MSRQAVHKSALPPRTLSRLQTEPGSVQSVAAWTARETTCICWAKVQILPRGIGLTAKFSGAEKAPLLLPSLSFSVLTEVSKP